MSTYEPEPQPDDTASERPRGESSGGPDDPASGEDRDFEAGDTVLVTFTFESREYSMMAFSALINDLESFTLVTLGDVGEMFPASTGTYADHMRTEEAVQRSREKVSDIVRVQTVSLTSPLEIVLAISLTSTTLVAIIRHWSRLLLELDLNRAEREALRVIIAHLNMMTTIEEIKTLPNDHPGKSEVIRAAELLERVHAIRISSGGTFLRRLFSRNK